jgi:hypothetical protein
VMLVARNELRKITYKRTPTTIHFIA